MNVEFWPHANPSDNKKTFPGSTSPKKPSAHYRHQAPVSYFDAVPLFRCSASRSSLLRFPAAAPSAERAAAAAAAAALLSADVRPAPAPDAAGAGAVVVLVGCALLVAAGAAWAGGGGGGAPTTGARGVYLIWVLEFKASA